MLDCAIVEPPKPRLRTGRGAMSSLNVDHRRMDELPTNRTGHAGGGSSLSCCANCIISSRNGASAGSESDATDAIAGRWFTSVALVQAARANATIGIMRFIYLQLH